MKLLSLLLGLSAAVTSLAQGNFVFNNRVGTVVDARFVLPTDPAGTSSVGTEFHGRLFGGPAGTPLDQLVPLLRGTETGAFEPAEFGFRGPAGSRQAGYVVPMTTIVPNVSSGPALVRVQVFNGTSWENATWRFDGTYDVWLANIPNLALGTSPLMLQAVPEQRLLWLVLAGASLAAVMARRHREGARHRDRPSVRAC